MWNLKKMKKESKFKYTSQLKLQNIKYSHNAEKKVTTLTNVVQWSLLLARYI